MHRHTNTVIVVVLIPIPLAKTVHSGTAQIVGLITKVNIFLFLVLTSYTKYIKVKEKQEKTSKKIKP